jgi:hypothetical protein
VYAKFMDIAKILDISYSEARALSIIAPSLMHISPPREGSRRSKFAAHHIGYLLSEQTLQEWAARTLKERCVLFHRRFPEVSISKSYLQKIYKDNKVKRKAITYTKKKKGLGSEKYEASLLMMRSEVMEALASKKKIVFIDEAMFTYSTNAMLAYAPNRQNICVDEKLSSAPAIAMVAGVSVERGLETWLTKPRSIDSDAFIAFIEQLVSQNSSKEITLFLDNATIHRSKKVTAFLKDNGIKAIFNVPYSP